MSRKRFVPEEIINKLREAEVLLSRNQQVHQSLRGWIYRLPGLGQPCRGQPN